MLIVLSAPSGGGKTTVCERLLAQNPDLTRAVTCTTRAPRGQERNGVDYYFLDAGEFLRRVQAGHFLEHATVYGNSYGTLKSEVLDKLRQDKDVMLTVDVQGAAAIKAQAAKDADLQASLVLVFLTPPSLAVLEQRLKKRGTDNDEARQRRLAVARHEIAQWRNFDYLVISTSIEEDVRRVQAILDAERMRQSRVAPPSFE